LNYSDIFAEFFPKKSGNSPNIGQAMGKLRPTHKQPRRAFFSTVCILGHCLYNSWDQSLRSHGINGAK
jgi:hypothetical protein